MTRPHFRGSDFSVNLKALIPLLDELNSPILQISATGRIPVKKRGRKRKMSAFSRKGLWCKNKTSQKTFRASSAKTYPRQALLELFEIQPVLFSPFRSDGKNRFFSTIKMVGRLFDLGLIPTKNKKRDLL